MIGAKTLLSGLSRQIKVHGSNVQVLKTPTEFRDTLLKLSSEARNRSRISTLYIGNGDSEREIVNNLVSSIKCYDCDVGVIIDRYRGTRDGAFVLKDLRRMAPVHLYQTPHCPRTRYRKPGMLGELLGVHHIKYYMFDDSVVISGANMSELYFGPRQDRYFLIKSKQLADYISYFHGMYSLSANVWDVGNYTKSHWSNATLQLAMATADTFSCSTPIENNATRDLGPADGDTYIYPLFQIPWFSVHQIDDALELLLLTADKNETFTFSSGYFNPSSRICDALKHTKAQVDIAIPSVEANGFYKGASVKGLVPDLYNFSALRTLKKCPNIRIHEYRRDGWSYHAKGVWSDNVTILGSSNFNKRSSVRDTEFSIALVTENSELKESLLAEKNRLLYFSNPLQKNYRSISLIGFPFMSNFL